MSPIYEKPPLWHSKTLDCSPPAPPVCVRTHTHTRVRLRDELATSFPPSTAGPVSHHSRRKAKAEHCHLCPFAQPPVWHRALWIRAPLQHCFWCSPEQNHWALLLSAVLYQMKAGHKCNTEKQQAKHYKRSSASFRVSLELVVCFVTGGALPCFKAFICPDLFF